MRGGFQGALTRGDGHGSGAAGSGGNRSGMPRPARTGPRLRSKKELFIENKFTGTKLAAEGPKQE